MKRVKATLHLLCLLCILSWSLPLHAVSYQVGDFVFDCNYNWGQLYATLIRYTGQDTIVEVPSKVMFQNNTYCVTAVGDEFYHPFVDNHVVRVVKLPETVVSIGDEAFMGCTSLRQIDLGRRLKHVGSYAFYACSNLESVTFYISVTHVGEYAFAYCSKLTTLQLGRNIKTLGEFVFDHTPLQQLRVIGRLPIQCMGLLSSDSSLYNNCTLQIPIGQTNLYRNADEWKKFNLMIETPELGDVNLDGSIDISDVNLTINHSLGIKLLPQFELGDINHDNRIDISDINLQINLVLGTTGI